MIIWHFFSLIKKGFFAHENVKNGNFDEKWVLIWTNLRIAINLSTRTKVPLSGIENSASKCLGFFLLTFILSCKRHKLSQSATANYIKIRNFITRVSILIIWFLGMYNQSPMMFPNPFLRKPKRIRTAFTPAQLMRLEQEFKKNQ